MIESLETRRLFSIAIVDGTLTIRGTAADEKLYVAWNKTGATTWDVRAFDGRARQTLSYDSAAPAFTAVSIYGGNGSDYLSAAATVAGFTNTFSPPVPVTMNGGAKNDRLHGGETGDVLLGGSGNDSLFGHGGDDTIDAEDGRDSVDGGDGNDTIAGGDGDDSVTAGAGDDRVTGGNGNDQLDAGEGNDLLSGGPGTDALFAGRSSGAPYFRGTNTDFGMDTLYGSAQGGADDVGDEKFY